MKLLLTLLIALAIYIVCTYLIPFEHAVIGMLSILLAVTLYSIATHPDNV